jgi:hypothetical protein
MEIDNPHNKFAPGRDWHLFEDHLVPAGWHDMPPWWTRFLGFPEGLPESMTLKADERPMTESAVAERLERALSRSLVTPPKPNKPKKGAGTKVRASKAKSDS